MPPLLGRRRPGLGCLDLQVFLGEGHCALYRQKYSKVILCSRVALRLLERLYGPLNRFTFQSICSDKTRPSDLVEQRIQHADAEHPAGGEREPEHERQVGAVLSLFLRRKERDRGDEEHACTGQEQAMPPTLFLMCSHAHEAQRLQALGLKKGSALLLLPGYTFWVKNALFFKIKMTIFI